MNPASAPASPTAPIEQSLHIKKLLNYLPIIILVVILLIGFVSWDIMENNWAVFTTLLIVCLFAGFVNFLNPFRFLEAKETDTLLIPRGVAGLTMDVWKWVFTSVAIILGIILGFTSLAAYREKDADPSKALMGIGGTILILMLIPMFAAIVKGFGNSARFPRIYNWFNDNFTTTRIIVGIIACIVFGVPLVVRGKQIEDKMNDNSISKEDKTQLSNDLALSSANTLLSIGLILQIVGFAIIAYWIWQNNTVEPTLSKGLSGFFMVALLIIGPILITGSQKKSKIYFNNAETEQGSFENKPLLAHGIIYLILGLVFVILLLGSFSLTQITFYKGGFFTLLLAFIVFINVSIGYVIDETSEKNKPVDRSSPYYEQLKTEVTKDLNKTKLAGADVTTAEIDAEMQKRYTANIKTPNHAVMGVFYTLSIIITVFILMFYNIRLKLAHCGKIPDSFGVWDAFSYVFRAPPDCSQVPPGTDLSTVNQAYPEKVKQDKMLSSDWDTILSSNTANNFSQMFVRFAKWFSLIPFLSVILIIMWVSILFTNITTSPRTSDWIAKTFTGDMFPRVKELIDTFFIVLIVGLLLCAILLLPIVKELNVGGLDSILKFAESIQVWQYNDNSAANQDKKWNWVFAIIGFCAIFFIVLSPWWKYLTQDRTADDKLPVIPDNWGWFIGFVVLWATASIPAWFHILPRVGSPTDPNFEKESRVTRGIRLLLTTVYLIPWLIVTIFKVILYGIGSLTGVEAIKEKFNEELDKLDFTKWTSRTDLRMFPLDNKPITPASVTSIAAVAPPVPAPGTAPPATSEPVGIDETKVSAIGKLIKVILLTVSFVILILSVIYYVYKIDATNRADGTDQAVADGGFVAQMNSPTAHTIYVIMAIVAIAGFVAHLREKFKSANAEKSPEDYLFNDVKPEDANSPMRQLTFALTHIIYIVLMIIVWVYDRDVDDKNRMSITGMTVLGIAILFFHYGLEFMDNRLPREPGAGASASAPPKMAPLRNLLSNVRFIMNTVFFIVLCALAYYKQHGVMVALIVFMFLFHLTKSILGLKLLKFLWACILYIPCLFLDFLQSSQSAVGDTTRPIWIIVAIELLLIAILYGGPYLLNYIGASASQMVGAPVPLNPQYDTNLTTQSPKVFIFHNTGMDRTPEDKAANCPIEEKKRYHYAISGWFLLNNSVTTKNNDLEIFNFGDTPKMTYNPYTNELKLTSATVNITTGNSEVTEVYNSRKHYNALTAAAVKDGSVQRKAKFQMLTEDDEIDADIPLQRWNYFIVNYDGKTMDLFLNNKLINRSDFIMPDIQLKPITVGSKDGLNGSMCNFAFHKYPLTKEQIRWTYTMLKSQNPPMIGAKTIKDEVNEAGTTTMYTR